MLRILRGAAGVALLLLLAGCGGGADTGEVSGAVQLDGKPVEAGAITFSPVDGKSPTSGCEIKGGRYTARVPIGRMKVAINVPKVVGKKKVYNTPDSPEMPVTAEALPPRYNQKTELELDVKSGSNPKDWDLHAK
jgi:hypothetical protein